MKILGLHGDAGSGKDTLANLLVESSSEEWVQYSFANPIRQMVNIGLGISMEVMQDPIKKNDPEFGYMGKSARYILQTLGTEWGRNLVSDSIWINEFKRRAKLITENTDCSSLGIVVTDCRFENEANAIRELGGHVVHIIRPNNPYTRSVNQGGVTKHASEAGLPSHLIDFTIINDTIPNEMLNKLINFMA